MNLDSFSHAARSFVRQLIQWLLSCCYCCWCYCCSHYGCCCCCCCDETVRQCLYKERQTPQRQGIPTNSSSLDIRAVELTR